jgi:hypothetical protein
MARRQPLPQARLSLGLSGPQEDHRPEAETGNAPQTGEAIVKLRTSLAAAGAAVVLGTTGALALPAIASAHSATHTLKFIAVQKATDNFTKATQGVQETDTNTAGKTIGFDMIYVAVTSPTSAAVNATVETTGGFLYGTFSLNLKTGAVTNGKVTGGTGAFAGATGTIKAKTISGTKHAVTITYSS